VKYLDPEKPSFAVIVFIFLSLLFTYPTIVQLSTHLIGGTADGWQFPWNNYVFRERVLNGEDPYYTDEVFYPMGVSLILHGYTEFNDVIGLILSPFFNDVAITNLMVIFATFLSGFGAYLLTRELTGSPLAGLFAGIAFAFCPFRMLRIIGHIHMALTQFLPLAIWTILKMAKTQKIKYAILTGLFFALACYCNYYFVIYLLIAFMLIVAYGLVRYEEWRTISFLRNLVISGAVAVLLLLPVAYHTYLLLKTGTAESYSGEEAFYVKNAADIGDYLRVAPLNRAILYALDKNPLIWPYSKVTSGLVVLLMFVPGIIFVFRKRPRYFGVVLFSGFVFFLLSLGPYLQITDSLRLPMLYNFISGMPILSHARSPERFGIMVNLVMAIVAGYMLSVIATKFSGIRKTAVCSAVFVLLLFELATIPYPMEAFDPPKIFYELAKNKGNTLLSLPFYAGNIRAKQYMRFQSVHEQRVMDGRVSRNPYPPIQYVKGIPITKTFHVMTIANKLDQNAIETDRKVAPLFRELFRVRTIALYPPFSKSQQPQDYVKVVFPDAQLLSNEKEILVYNLPEQEIRSYSLSAKDEAISFLLLENWAIEHRTYRLVCRTDQAKLLLPDLKADEILKLNLMLRGIKLKSGEMNLQMQVGDHSVGSNSLKPNPRLWKIEIPGDVVVKLGRIAQINIRKTFPDSVVELQSIAVEISRK
jgi:Dolichyl-phosphate-mannose-protein mannosyltransferase